ncbi:S1 family peptidase [Mycolicibacterium wolinskyi]|uniref:S1 family peptidase n=1 Tax=Mycolicibacterium wolinskyi TaxID=59750 RepID=UPI0012FFAFF6|nr:serine protease [Mycolicibacterium wolinskyi]
MTKDAIHPIGTAFCISHVGVWVTARHNLEGRDGAFDIRDRNPGSHIAILWIGSGLNHNVPSYIGGTVPVRSITRHPASGTDLALLFAEKPNVTFPALTLSARLPVEGTPIVGLGYAQIEVSLIDKNPARPNIDITPNLNVSSGTVNVLYENGRDTYRDYDGNFTGKLPTVCFETSARFDSGMSGGPVLDPTGAVCGVISTGLDQHSDEVQYTSYASGTPYLFMMKVAFGHNDKKIGVYELAERAIVLVDESFERLRVEESDDLTHVYYA